MTHEEVRRLKTLFVGMSAYYGHTIHDDALALYAEDLKDLPFDLVSDVLSDLRRDSKITRCPLPAQVRARIEPEGSPAAVAIVVASEIVQAIARCGPYRTPELSELAVAVVNLEGGWEQVCELANNDNLPSLKAQWRELARSLLETGRVDRVSTIGVPDARIARLLTFVRPMPKGPA